MVTWLFGDGRLRPVTARRRGRPRDRPLLPLTDAADGLAAADGYAETAAIPANTQSPCPLLKSTA
jgi:hypothetical protein